MKIADFFVQITAKGDLKELKAVIEYQKTLKRQSDVAIAKSKVKVEQLKKETAEVINRGKAEDREFKIQQKKVKEEAKKPKTLKEYLTAQGKIFSQQNKMNGLLAKGVLQTMGLTGAVIGLAAAFVATCIQIDKMVTKLGQANQLYTNFQRQTGMPINNALGVSGAMANLDVTMSPEDVMRNMQQLQSNLVSIQFGMGNIAPYQMAGINPWGINSANMLDVIRRQMKGFAPAYRTFLLQQMGLDPRLGALIDLSDTEYLKYKEESLQLYLSPEDRKAIQNLAPEWNKVNLKFSKAWDRFVLILSRDFVGLASILADLFNTLVDILNVFNTILKPLLDILTLILKPIYLLLDDLIGFLIGKDSIIGRSLSGDWERTRGAAGALFGVDSPNANRAKEGLLDLAKFMFDTPLGQSMGFLMNPNAFLLNNLLPNLMQPNNNKNVSMKNDININVGSASDGQAMINPMNLVFNSAIAQLARA